MFRLDFYAYIPSWKKKSVILIVESWTTTVVYSHENEPVSWWKAEAAKTPISRTHPIPSLNICVLNHV